jgi:hypothetical protein
VKPFPAVDRSLWYQVQPPKIEGDIHVFLNILVTLLLSWQRFVLLLIDTHTCKEMGICNTQIV